jgi:rare lipoprotein A
MSTRWLVLFASLLIPFCSGGPNVRTTPPAGTGGSESGQVRARAIEGSPAAGSAVIQTGVASWYGGRFHGRQTANGEVYDMYMLTAAHQTLPFHSIVEVQNLENSKKIIVRINDRGPFVSGRIIDLSYKAAKLLGIVGSGTAPVSLRIVRPGDVVSGQTRYSESREYYLQAGAFRVLENARRMYEKLRGVDAGLAFSIRSGDGYHRVVSDRLTNRSEAAKYKRILDRHGIDTFIREVF